MDSITMQNLASITIDLLCAVTFQPPEGNDPEQIAELEQQTWQKLIHDLSPAELEAVQSSVRNVISELSRVPVDTLPTHLQEKLYVLQQFLDGELQ